MSKNNKKIFVCIIFTFFQTLSSAEDKSFTITPVLSNNEIVLRLVACQYLDDHDAICSFAQVNKAHHNYMLSVADTRKKLLFKAITCEYLGSVWHKYGSAYCQAYRQKDLNELMLTHSTLRKGQSSKCNYHLSRFISPLPYKQVPFFNDKGTLCFYGYGMVRLYSEEETLPVVKKDILTLIQYQSFNIQAIRLRCLMAKQGDESAGKQVYHRFDFCMEYPFLLKAILNSSHVTNCSNDKELIFWLDGVTIPNNYAEKTPIDDLSDNWAHNSLEHLPAIIKDFITKSKN